MSPWRPAAWAFLRTGSVLASEELCRVLYPLDWTGGVLDNWGLAVGCSLQGRLQWVCGEAVLPLLCGTVWPLALRELAASPDKSS